MSNSVILGLLRAIREGDADAVLPLSDLLEEAGRKKCADAVREIVAETNGFEVANTGDTVLEIDPETELGKACCRQVFARMGEDCPECGGNGEHTIYEDVYNGYGNIQSVGYSSPCHSCDGTGVRLKEFAAAVFEISPDRTITLDESAFANGPILITNPGPGMLTVQLPDGFTSTSVSPGTSLGFAPDSWPFDSACPYLPESSP